MKETFLKDKDGKIKLEANETNWDFIEELEKSCAVFWNIGTDKALVHKFNSHFYTPNNKFKKVYLDKQFINFIKQNKIINKLGRINIELNLIGHAFEYIDQFLTRCKNYEVPHTLLFTYFYNMTLYFIAVRLRSLIDPKHYPDDVTIKDLLKTMKEYNHKIELYCDKNQSKAIVEHTIKTKTLYMSFQNVIETRTVSNFINFVNKNLKHVTSKKSNGEVPTLFISITQESITIVQELYALYQYLKDVVYETIMVYFFPFYHTIRYPQFGRTIKDYCTTEYCSIFRNISSLNALNQAMDIMIGWEKNKKSELQKRIKEINKNTH